MNIKYLFVVSLTLLLAIPKKGYAQTVDVDLMSIDDFSEGNLFMPDNDEDNIFGDDDPVITTSARTLQNAAPTRGIYTDDFLYRWYIQAGAGAQFLMGEDDSKARFLSRQTFAPSLTVGYRFNPIFGVRLNFSGGSLHGFNDGHSGTYRFWKGKNETEKRTVLEGWGWSKTDINKYVGTINRYDPQWHYKGWTYNDQIHFNDKEGAEGPHWIPGRSKSDGGKGELYMQHVRYVAANAAITMNLFNLFGGANDARKFDMSLYAGPTVFHVFPHLGQEVYNGFGVNGGLQAQYHISDKFAIQAEFNGSAMPDDFDGQLGGDTFDLIGQALLGITYKFPTDRWQRAVIPTAPPVVQDEMNEELNKIRAELMAEMNEIVDLQPEIDRLRAQLAGLNQKPKVETVEPEKESFFLPDPIHFAIGKTDIDAAGWTVIERVAAYMNNNPDATVIITGYADKDTGTDAVNERLSRERSKKVADALVYRFNIPQNRVAIDWRGDSVQPFYQNKLNRAVLFYIEFD